MDAPAMKHIAHISEMTTYVPPGHSGTQNVRLVEKGFDGSYEMVLGTVEPGGVADRHSHATESQAMYVIAGRAKVALGDDAAAEYGPGTIFRIPPGLDHLVESLGPAEASAEALSVRRISYLWELKTRVPPSRSKRMTS